MCVAIKDQDWYENYFASLVENSSSAEVGEEKPCNKPTASERSFPKEKEELLIGRDEILTGLLQVNAIDRKSKIISKRYFEEALFAETETMLAEQSATINVCEKKAQTERSSNKRTRSGKSLAISSDQPKSNIPATNSSSIASEDGRKSTSKQISPGICADSGKVNEEMRILSSTDDSVPPSRERKMLCRSAKRRIEPEAVPIPKKSCSEKSPIKTSCLAEDGGARRSAPDSSAFRASSSRPLTRPSSQKPGDTSTRHKPRLLQELLMQINTTESGSNPEQKSAIRDKDCSKNASRIEASSAKETADSKVGNDIDANRIRSCEDHVSHNPPASRKNGGIESKCASEDSNDGSKASEQRTSDGSVKSALRRNVSLEVSKGRDVESGRPPTRTSPRTLNRGFRPTSLLERRRAKRQRAIDLVDISDDSS